MRSISLLMLTFGGLLTLSGCGNGDSFSTAAAVKGTADAHCAGKPAQATDPAVCKMEGMATADDYGDTMSGSEGDDDDCKYHVRWTSTDVAESQDVTFRVVVTKKTDESALTGANPAVEV